MTFVSWEVIFLRGLISTYYEETFDDPAPFKTAPSVPNITSPLPHCMLLSGLCVFDSHFPSTSCGHVGPSSVPPLFLPCPSVLFVWNCWVEPGGFGVLIVFTPTSHLLTCCWSCYDPTPYTAAVLQSSSLSSFICKTPEEPWVPKIHSFDFLHENLSTINLPDLGSLGLLVLTTLTSGCEQEISFNVSTYLFSVSVLA